MRTIKTIKVALLMLLAGSFSAYSQNVTIGASEAAADGALLQLKETTGVTTDAANATKGLAFPRVTLTHRNDLRPMFSGGASDAQKVQHTGLVVFNTSTSVATDESTFTFKKGLYLWNGSRWGSVASSEVGNGLRVDGDSIKLGGTLTDGTTTITVGANNLIFDNAGTPAYTNLTAGVGLMFKDLPDITSNSVGLVVDRTTGRIGVNAVSNPAQLLFWQSGDETYTGDMTAAGVTNEDDVNASNTYIIPWTESADEFTNNILNFIPAENAFVVPDTVSEIMLELSGYIGYIANQPTVSTAAFNPSSTGTTAPAQNGDNYKTIVNAAIQVLRLSEGKTQYENWTSMRGVFLWPSTPYRQTLSIPPALVKLAAGDKIRMVVIPRPSSLGAVHSSGRVVKPYGTSISKAIKIIAQ